MNDLKELELVVVVDLPMTEVGAEQLAKTASLQMGRTVGVVHRPIAGDGWVVYRLSDEDDE